MLMGGNMAGNQICENCKFWEQTGATDTGLIGECHKNSPSPQLEPSPDQSGMRFAVWPSTVQNQWCGDFENRPMGSAELAKRMAIIEQMESERKKKK
jgi:hypothetical protein